jgi:type IV pilus biogenesis protein CpaD/CtpE
MAMTAPLSRPSRWLHPRASALRHLLAALVLVLLPSCTAPSLPPAFDGPATPRVDRIELRHTVHFATDSDQLTAEERARLALFLETLPGRPVGPVRISGHADERASTLYNLDLAARRAQAVAEFLRARTDLQLTVDTRSLGEHWPVDPGQGPAAWERNRRAEIDVIIPVIRIEGCDPEPSLPGYRLDNGPVPGLGCATARNLAAMLADPGDFATPRELEPAPAEAAAMAVGRYRAGQVTPLQDIRGLGQ